MVGMAGEGLDAGDAVMPLAVGREAAVARLLSLDSRGELSSARVRLVASSSGVSERTVWSWLAAARSGGRTGRKARSRFTVTDEMRRSLALWGGNVSAVHRELVARAARDPLAGPVPSLSVFHRAVVRDLSPGERAGLRVGEAARRRYDVYGKRPPTHRNACWEGDHKRVPVRVSLDGVGVCPWVTWFIDVASKVVVGVAVTPHQAGPGCGAGRAAHGDQPGRPLRSVRGSAGAGAGGPGQGLPLEGGVARSGRFRCPGR